MVKIIHSWLNIVHSVGSHLAYTACNTMHGDQWLSSWIAVLPGLPLMAPLKKQVHDQAVNYDSHLMNVGGGKWWHICPSPTRIIVCNNVLYVIWEITHQSNGHTNIHSIFAMIFQGTRAPSTTKQLQLSCKTRCVLEMQLDLGVILWVSFSGQ